jgi:hypothetical protein
MGFNMQTELASQWLSKDDVTIQGTDACITRITSEQVGDDRDQKFAMHFQGNLKPLLLNKTNTRIMVALYGADSDGWLGKTIQLYNDPTIGFGGQITGGVRVRPSQNHPPRLPATPVRPTPEQIVAYMRASKGGGSMDDLKNDIPF